MKIIIIAMRHWSAGRRYRSLALNAKRLGHQVWGFSGAVHHDDPLTIAAFNELGVEAYHGNELKSKIDQINPDLVCGERYHPLWPVERLGQDWVNKRGRVGFMLNHTVIQPYEGGPNPGPRSHLLVTNEEQKAVKTPPRDPRWSASQVHVLGAPGFDWVTEKFDIPKIRAKLGVMPNQPLIGLFLDPNAFARPEYPRFLAEARQRGWKVALHPHPMTRRLQNANSDFGFLQPSENKPGLLKAQEMGAKIVVDYAPGKIENITFEQCSGFELIATADCLFSNSHDPMWEAYALGRGCHLFPSRDLAPHHLFTELVDWAYESGTDVVAKAQQTLNAGSNSVEQNPELIAKRLFKLDGLWWQRALSLAESLMR